MLDRDACYRALQTRDARFDGRFYTCVTTTRIFCRPICPAPTPRPEHCLFVPSAAAAHAAGFRPCLRCRPEVAPWHGAAAGTANTVSRAVGLIAEGALDDDGVETLAARLGVGDRHLRRLFRDQLGTTPLALAQVQRLLLAKALLTDSGLGMAEIALASGFGSIRRFNDAFRRAYGRPPGALRRAGGGEGGGVTLRLTPTQPYDWPSLHGFLARRCLAGVEAVADGRYARTIAADGAVGRVELAPSPDGQALSARIVLSRLDRLAAVVARLRRLLDLDADMAAIADRLGHDERLAAPLSRRPGLRVPGCWDGFELAVRAILGQQVSVAGAVTLGGRLVAAYGEPLPPALAGGGVERLFPTPEALSSADLAGIGLPGARARAVRSLAAAAVADPGLLSPHAPVEETCRRLVALPGIGPWTAEYVAMRALRSPDAFPAGDLALVKALGRPDRQALLRRAEAWRPWRAYAVMHLWMEDTP